ncbi:hypothetical protein GQ53DRAFT_753885 [Thozetella sp. PMI_491]|nr:hypothetical protein GQ53DRAFT_753885 [Thozetella sp. PMI_491]
MTPLVPRMHLFEIDDQPWFPAWFRSRVQHALMLAWITTAPILQKASAAHVVAGLLRSNLADTIREYVFIDFCAGGGGPTPFVEKLVNAQLAAEAPVANGKAAAADKPVQFVLTDLHPHPRNWSEAAKESPNISYVDEPVDASSAPASLIERVRGQGKKVFRLFNLAFHHFDDPLARAILRDTVETSDGFGIFELQSRDIGSFFTCLVFGAGILILAPYYAYLWRSPATLFWVYCIPVLPFVLVFDGWISSLRTRTPDEVEALFRTCRAYGGGPKLAKELEQWEIRSGRIMFLWPVGHLHWIVGLKNAKGRKP